MILSELNYAQKNKCTWNCSTYTYLDEEKPSRLDLGKRKFGGPFTVEEVEDVKTVLHIISLLVMVTGIVLSLDFNGTFHLHIILTTMLSHRHIVTLPALVYYLTSVILIPFYGFILYPVFSNYILSMISIVGTGLFLCLVHTLINLTLDTVGHLHSNTAHYMFDTNT